MYVWLFSYGLTWVNVYYLDNLLDKSSKENETVSFFEILIQTYWNMNKHSSTTELISEVYFTPISFEICNNIAWSTIIDNISGNWFVRVVSGIQFSMKYFENIFHDFPTTHNIISFQPPNGTEDNNTLSSKSFWFRNSSIFD